MLHFIDEDKLTLSHFGVAKVYNGSVSEPDESRLRDTACSVWLCGGPWMLSICSRVAMSSIDEGRSVKRHVTRRQRWQLTSPPTASTPAIAAAAAAAARRCATDRRSVHARPNVDRGLMESSQAALIVHRRSCDTSGHRRWNDASTTGSFAALVVIIIQAFNVAYTYWLGIVTVRTLNLRSRGRRFNSRCGSDRYHLDGWLSADRQTFSVHNQGQLSLSSIQGR